MRHCTPAPKTSAGHRLHLSLNLTDIKFRWLAGYRTRQPHMLRAPAHHPWNGFINHLVGWPNCYQVDSYSRTIHGLNGIFGTKTLGYA